MKRSIPKQNRWQDHYARRAKKERFPARSVYKLKEIQKKHNLIKKGDNVLDLGCFPGSWLLYAADLTGDKGQVVGIDLEPITVKLPSHVRTYTGDILSMDDELFESLGKNFNLVISDMSPATTGNKQGYMVVPENPEHESAALRELRQRIDERWGGDRSAQDDKAYDQAVKDEKAQKEGERRWWRFLVGDWGS